MSMVPQPHREVDLIMGAGAGLSGALEQKQTYDRAQEEANAPGDPFLDKYINRLLAGEHPDQLAAEARQDPMLAAALERLKNGPAPFARPQDQVPDVGAPGGQPSLANPGAFSPAAGPRMPQNVQQAQVGAREAAGGAMFQPRSLSAPMPFEGTPGTLRGQPVSGLTARDAMVNMAQPMQAPTGGMPGASYQSGPSSPPPQARPQPQPQQAAAEPRLRTVKEQQRLMGLLPALAAGQSREQVARTTADARTAAANLRSSVNVLTTLLKQQGLDADRILKSDLGLEGLDDKQQQAVLNAIIKLKVAELGADATLGAARTRADAASSPEASAEKELRTARSNVARITAAPDWNRDPAAMDAYKREMDRVTYLEKVVGRPGGEVPPPALRQPAPAPAPQKQPPPAQKPPPGKGPAGKTIRVKNKATGATGSIPEGNFDPAKYERI